MRLDCVASGHCGLHLHNGNDQPRPRRQGLRALSESAALSATALVNILPSHPFAEESVRTGLPALKFASVTPAMAGQRPGSPLMSRAVQVPPQACRPVPVRLLRDGPSHSSGTAGPRLGRTADVTHLALSLALVLAIPVRSTESR